MADAVREALATLTRISQKEQKDTAGLSAADLNSARHLLGIRKWNPLDWHRARQLCWRYRRQLHHWGYIWDGQGADRKLWQKK